MARIDKVAFSFRAPAGESLTGVLAVKLNTAGAVVRAGSAEAIGVVCLPGTIATGRPVSVLRNAEIVEFGGTTGGLYYAVGTAGSIGSTAGGTFVGVAVEADRLVVAL